MKAGDICRCKGCYSSSPDGSLLCRCVVRLDEEDFDYKTWKVSLLKKCYSPEDSKYKIGERIFSNHCTPQTINLVPLTIEELLEI